VGRTEDVGVVEICGGSFVLDLAVGLVGDERAVGDCVDVDSFLNAVSLEVCLREMWWSWSS